jgi:hypothetical protein
VSDQHLDAGIYAEFGRYVNMTAGELDTWLRSEDSKASGQHKDGGESTGHQSGRNIVGILRTKRGDLSDADEKQMHRVVGYIKRHLAQRPSGDVEHTTWRYSLMNWGHDPLKD